MLLDFNLADDTKKPDSAARAHVGGTLPYMAPEHLDALEGGMEPVDARCDIFSLGVILFELLAGRRPYQKLPPGRPWDLSEMIAALATAFVVPRADGSRREARAPALASWETFQEQRDEARFLLTRLSDPDRPNEASEAGERALAVHEVLDRDDWRDRPDVRNL